MPHAEQSLTFVMGTHTSKQNMTHACGIRNLLQISMGLQAAAATVLLCSNAYCEVGNIIQSSKLAVTLDAFFLCCAFIVIHHISCTYLHFFSCWNKQIYLPIWAITRLSSRGLPQAIQLPSLLQSILYTSLAYKNTSFILTNSQSEFVNNFPLLVSVICKLHLHENYV